MSKVLRIGILHLGVGRLDGNHHRWWKENGEWKSETIRSSAQIVELGKDCFVITEGRRLFGYRLWIYGRTGSCVNFDVFVRFKKSPCKPPSQYAPGCWKPGDGESLG